VVERRAALLEWLETFDVERYLLDAGMDADTVERLKQLLVD